MRDSPSVGTGRARHAPLGYTLMEVLVALTILATGLTILLGTQASSARMSERANNMALAALLARSKMIDVEHELLSEGFSDMEETARGTFRDEGFDEIEWEALIEVIEITDDAQEEFNTTVYEQLFGDGEGGGSLSGSTAVSSFLPMLMAQIPPMINDMAERSRKVTLTVSWEEGRGDMTLTVQQFVVNLNPGGAEGELPEQLAPTIDPNAIQGLQRGVLR
jgi:general secretion pathway protein I